MKVDCVFFDYDGVLTTDSTGSMTTCRYLSVRTGVPIERVRAAFARRNHELTLGQLTHEDVWPEICEAIGCTLPQQVLQEAFDSTPANHPMIDLARRCRRECRVAIITDNKLDRMLRLTAVQQLDALFGLSSKRTPVGREVGGCRFDVVDFEIVVNATRYLDFLGKRFQHQANTSTVDEHQVACARQLPQTQSRAIEGVGPVGVRDWESHLAKHRESHGRSLQCLENRAEPSRAPMPISFLGRTEEAPPRL